MAVHYIQVYHVFSKILMKAASRSSFDLLGSFVRVVYDENIFSIFSILLRPLPNCRRGGGGAGASPRLPCDDPVLFSAGLHGCLIITMIFFYVVSNPVLL